MARRKTIVVVEDEPSLRFLAVKILELSGHLVMSAENAEEAKDIWKRVGKGVDLLLTDVVMPGLDGVELARELRANHADLKIIFVTGSLDRTAELERMGGATRIVMKPYTVQDMRSAVEA